MSKFITFYRYNEKIGTEQIEAINADHIVRVYPDNDTADTVIETIGGPLRIHPFFSPDSPENKIRSTSTIDDILSQLDCGLSENDRDHMKTLVKEREG